MKKKYDHRFMSDYPTNDILQVSGASKGVGGALEQGGVRGGSGASGGGEGLEGKRSGPWGRASGEGLEVWGRQILISPTLSTYGIQENKVYVFLFMVYRKSVKFMILY